jgi:hypothetical protein
MPLFRIKESGEEGDCGKQFLLKSIVDKARGMEDRQCLAVSSSFNAGDLFVTCGARRFSLSDLSRPNAIQDALDWMRGKTTTVVIDNSYSGSLDMEEVLKLRSFINGATRLNNVFIYVVGNLMLEEC